MYLGTKHQCVTCLQEAIAAESLRRETETASYKRDWDAWHARLLSELGITEDQALSSTEQSAIEVWQTTKPPPAPPNHPYGLEARETHESLVPHKPSTELTQTYDPATDTLTVTCPDCDGVLITVRNSPKVRAAHAAGEI